MLLGKRFFPETGIPIWKIARRSVLFAVWLPEPLTVATWIEHSLTMGARSAAGFAAGSVVVWDMDPRGGTENPSESRDCTGPLRPAFESRKRRRRRGLRPRRRLAAPRASRARRADAAE